MPLLQARLWVADNGPASAFRTRRVPLPPTATITPTGLYCMGMTVSGVSLVETWNQSPLDRGPDDRFAQVFTLLTSASLLKRLSRAGLDTGQLWPQRPLHLQLSDGDGPAAFDPVTNRIQLPTDLWGRQRGADGDTVIHEVWHAVQHALAPKWRHASFGRVHQEALADLAAAMHYDDPGIAQSDDGVPLRILGKNGGSSQNGIYATASRYAGWLWRLYAGLAAQTSCKNAMRKTDEILLLHLVLGVDSPPSAQQFVSTILRATAIVLGRASNWNKRLTQWAREDGLGGC